VPEHEFADRINAALAAPGTIGVGYNSIRFDDEVTRFLLWRNLIDPYAREWRDGCGRWDLLDVVRCATLRPEGIEWPQADDGTTSFKLERLSAANGLAHERARRAVGRACHHRAGAPDPHDQPPAVRVLPGATKKSARRRNWACLPRCARHGPFCTSVAALARARCIAVMAPLAMHPSNKNELLAWDLVRTPPSWPT
jgi:exodeoxyribonuclease-1